MLGILLIALLLCYKASPFHSQRVDESKLYCVSKTSDEESRNEWRFKWCSTSHVVQAQHKHNNTKPTALFYLNKVYLPSNKKNMEYFSDNAENCWSENQRKNVSRIVKVRKFCCPISSNNKTKISYILNSTKLDDCAFNLDICSWPTCVSSKSEILTDERGEIHEDMYKMSPKERNLLKQRVLRMFYKSYDGYMKRGYPKPELLPISCKGTGFSPINVPLLTLIDTLDTLAIIGNFSEFRSGIKKISTYYHNSKFDINVNVSLFETTIRILGGLLASHLFATDSRMQKLEKFKYNGILLELAIDLGNRLMPAFRTRTGIPFGTVNLRNGVSSGETLVANLAGAGSLLIEFSVLSILSNNNSYHNAAKQALIALYDRRSHLSLFGKHIHSGSGSWSELSSGIGSNSDSFYEYLAKAHWLFSSLPKWDTSTSTTLINNSSQDIYWRMFLDTYSGIKRHNQFETFFKEVDMVSGLPTRNRVENLHCFWPGIESSIGLYDSASELLNTFFAIQSDLGFVPEELDEVAWLQRRQPMNSYYPLRPELIESTYFHYKATNDESWLFAAKMTLINLERFTEGNCGHCSVKSINSMELKDEMPTFFLSETCKYLFLIFDDNNFIDSEPYIFSTQAHPYNLMQLYSIAQSNADFHSEDSLKRQTFNIKQSVLAKQTIPLFKQVCPVSSYWDKTYSFSLDYEQDIRKKLSRPSAISSFLALNRPIDIFKSSSLSPYLTEDMNNRQSLFVILFQANLISISTRYTEAMSKSNSIDRNLHSNYYGLSSQMLGDNKFHREIAIPEYKTSVNFRYSENHWETIQNILRAGSVYSLETCDVLQ